MVAGLNFTIRVIRNNDNGDDDVGGAQPTGVVIYPMLFARRQQFNTLLTRRFPLERLNPQGLESERSHIWMLSPSTVDVRENDMLEIVTPTNHPDIRTQFRVLGTHTGDFHPSDPRRGYLFVSTRQMVKAHRVQ